MIIYDGRRTNGPMDLRTEVQMNQQIDELWRSYKLAEGDGISVYRYVVEKIDVIESRHFLSFFFKLLQYLKLRLYKQLPFSTSKPNLFCLQFVIFPLLRICYDKSSRYNQEGPLSKPYSISSV